MTIALITGGSRGIGRAICVELAKAGHDIAINYAGNAAAAEETRALCLAAAANARTSCHAAESASTTPAPKTQDTPSTPPRIELFQADVSDEASCKALYQNVEEALGAPGILINNAGITRDNLLMRMSVEDFDAVLAVNLRSAFILTKLACRAMLRARMGRIVNIASVAGITGNIGQANYAASKAGVIGLTKTAAKELAGKGVTVNAVAPGLIRSDMTDILDEKIKADLLQGIPVKRIGEPHDVAQLVAFLASEQASYITGQIIAVDGGMTI
jgi:3-oxoacyl-[acyl-carrier protein] reductase